MEDGGFIDERELQGWKGACVCITCQHFTDGVDQHCHTLLSCNLRQQQLQQGKHLKKKCTLWAPEAGQCGFQGSCFRRDCLKCSPLSV